MVLFFPNTLTNIDSILTNIIDLPNNNVLFQGDIYKNGPLRFYIDNTLVQTLDSTGITIDVPKNITDDFKITGNLVMSTEAGGGKGRLFFTDTTNNLTNYITYESSNKIKIQVGDLNINSTNTNIVGNLTLPNNSIISSFINTGAVDSSKLSNTLDLSSKTITLPNNSITNSMLNNNIVDGSKLSNTLDLSGKTISNITLPNLPQRINTRGYTFEFLRDGETIQTLAQHDTLTDTENVSIHNVFAGDVNVNSFWGISCNLYNGRLDLLNATQSRDSSSFTINKKDSATTYERLLTCDLNGRVSTNALSINGGSTSVACGIKGRTRIQALSALESSAVIELKPINLSGEITFLYSNGVNDLVLEIGTGQEKIRVLQNGNVGIGLNNPTEKLEVEGKIKCDGLRVTESLSIFTIPDPLSINIEPKGCLSFRITGNNKTIRLDSSLNKNNYLTTIYNPSDTDDRTLTFTFDNSGTYTYVISNNQNGGLTTNSGVSSSAYTLKKFQMQQFMIYKIGTTIYIHTSE